MTDVLKQLSPASWRGIRFPVTGQREFAFGQRLEKHEIIFLRPQLIEALGPENPTYSYTIPFREDIRVAPWRNLFSDVYPKFLRACQDDSSGMLVDPLHGPVRAKCVSFRESIDTDRRDGCDVMVEFVFAPEMADGLPASELVTVEGAKLLAGALEREVQGIRSEDQAAYDEFIERFQGDGRKLTNLFDIPHKVGSQLIAADQDVSSKLEEASYRLDRSASTMDKLKQPQNAQTRQSMRRLELSARRFTATSADVVEVEYDTSVTALAALYGLTAAALLQLNPGLARRPRVKAGQKVRVSAA